MSELVTDEMVEEAAARALVSQHWDGEGCGTHGVNACVNCFGPSPYTAREVAREVLRVAAPLIAARALREAADGMYDHPHTGCYKTVCSDCRERNVRTDVRAYLRSRATRIENGASA